MTTPDIATPVQPPALADYVDRASAVSEAVERAEAAFEDAKRRRADLMRDMRRSGHTWTDIARVLGVSQQRASKLGRSYGID